MPYLPPSRISDVLANNRDSLVQCIGVTVAESLESAVALNGGKPNEVWMLYSFFVRGLPALERRLNSILGQFALRVTISGILCHKNPLVEFQYEPAVPAYAGLPRRGGKDLVKGRCEIADIAFLTTYGGRLLGEGIGNAMLAQTKLDGRDLGSNMAQTALYEQVRKFRYAARSHRRAGRELPPKNDPALWNWVLAQGHHEHPSHGNSCFGLPLNSHLDTNWRGTAWALYQLMTGVIGEGFALPKARAIGWDRIIFDLLEVTCKKTTQCRNAYVSTIQTLRGERALQAVNEVLAHRGGRVVKNSFGRIFGRWGKESLGRLGEKLEKAQSQYLVDELMSGFGGTGGFPPQKAGLETEGEGGGSFIIIDIEDLRPPAELPFGPKPIRRFATSD